jgi:enoyl-CoA hydratase
MIEEVMAEKRGAIGLITLNRPQALNALNRTMCLSIHRLLDEWRDDGQVKAVVIQGAGDRAFCAGGDVVSVYHAGKSGSPDWEAFFYDEYRMNHAIATYPKPYVALIDGITMGGGVGLSIHAPYRVATERTLFAMPETGLTGARLKAGDCVHAGIATHYCASEQIEALVEALAAGEQPVEATLGDFDTDLDGDTLDAHRAAIDRHFAPDSVEVIVASLEGGDGWAKEQAATLRKMSPTSCKLTLRALREGTKLDIGQALKNEYRVVCAIKRGHDFYEGIRAQLIDKDRNPKWRPATLGEVSDAEIDGYFQTPEGGDLRFD